MLVQKKNVEKNDAFKKKFWFKDFSMQKKLNKKFWFKENWSPKFWVRKNKGKKRKNKGKKKLSQKIILDTKCFCPKKLGFK